MRPEKFEKSAVRARSDMILRIGYEIIFEAPVPTPMLLMLNVHPAVKPALRNPETLRIEPEVPVESYVDGFGNVCGRIVVPAGKTTLTYDNFIEVSGEPEPVALSARQHPVEELPAETLVFLLASRYCEVDRLSPLAWSLFDQTPPGWERVQAICDWVHSHIEFGYKYARATKSAYDAYLEKNGVCRDYMHLAISLCRAMHIPARYASGYLGDIGVPLSPDPMDFSAFFEVYLGGEWRVFDARNNMRRIGRVPMVYGRDAADVALTTSFGQLNLEKFVVWTDEVG